MTRRSSIGANSTYNMVGSLLPVLISLITIPLYLDLIGLERYGVLAISWLILGYFGLFDFGLTRATAFHVAVAHDRPKEERSSLIWTSLLSNLLLGTIGGIALWAASTWFFSSVFKVDDSIRQEVLNSIPWLAISLPVATMISVLIGALQGQERFLLVNAVSTISTALFQIVPLSVAALWTISLPFLVSAALAARLVTLVCLCVIVSRGVPLGRPEFDIKRFRALIGFGGWVLLTSSFAPLLMISDRLIIGSMIGAAAVAIYTVPFQLAQRIAIIPTAIAHATFPRLSSASPEEHRRLGALTLQTVVSLMTVPVLLAIVGAEPFLRWWLGDDLGGKSFLIARVILIGFWANAFATVCHIRLQSMGRPDLSAKTHCAEVPLYVAALIISAEMYGLIGCAIVFAARCLLEYFVLCYLAEGRVRHLLSLSFNLPLLVAAALLPSYTLVHATPVVLTSSFLACVALAVSAFTLPREVWERLLSAARRLTGMTVASRATER